MPLTPLSFAFLREPPVLPGLSHWPPSAFTNRSKSSQTTVALVGTSRIAHSVVQLAELRGIGGTI